MSSFEEIQDRLDINHQSHLLEFWDDLKDDEQESFIEQLDTIDFNNVNNLFKRAISSLNEDVKKLDSRMEPIPPAHFQSEQSIDAKLLSTYRARGLEEIANNHVAVLLMAGGQGTRLGVTHPKGMYSVGLPSGKSLFQVQAERIRKVLRLAAKHSGHGCKITWYIMTSGPTNLATEQYLKDNAYFGLHPSDVVLFQQGLLPCFDFNGKILLESKSSVALAPDGNGGIYRALVRNGILEDMRNRDIRYVHVHSVDNILVKVADPVFIGYCVIKGADCGAKVVSKQGPLEAVGVVCQVDGLFQVVEYSEITEATASKRDKDGKLAFNAGNICNHFFTRKFLEQVGDQYEEQLKLHVAKKKITHVDKTGETVKPFQPNGIKIEKFVFDVFQFTSQFVTWEVPRNSEFSALKNADAEGAKDCPSTARRDLLALHKSYVEQAGGIVKNVEVEISPLLSYAGEDLEKKVKGVVFESASILKADEEVAGEINGLCNNRQKINGKH